MVTGPRLRIMCGLPLRTPTGGSWPDRLAGHLTRKMKMKQPPPAALNQSSLRLSPCQNLVATTESPRLMRNGSSPPAPTMLTKKVIPVMYKGVLYRSKINGNVWSPEAYPDAWEVVTT